LHVDLDLDALGAPAWIESDGRVRMDPEPAPEPKPPARAPKPDTPATAPAPELAEVSFVRRARRQAFWRQTWVRMALWVISLLLVVSLTLQVVVFQRDRLVAAYPTLLPWVQSLCQPLGCEVAPLHQIDSVLIDSSALVRVADGVYRFEVVLKNTSALMLAVPAVELSLTNAQDEVVVRKVVMPADWSAAPEELAPKSDTPLALRMSLVQATDLRMTGYRALVFYP
jgi:hypothetical protein